MNYRRHLSYWDEHEMKVQEHFRNKEYSAYDARKIRKDHEVAM